MLWFESGLIGLCMLLGWRQLSVVVVPYSRQWLLGLGTLLLFAASVSPWLDQLARYSLWLHSWQSVMLHLLLPLLWAAATVQSALVPSASVQCASVQSVVGSVTAGLNEGAGGSGKSRGERSAELLPKELNWVLAVISGFAVMLWMLPAFHGLGMSSAIWYSAGKWLMVISGLLMCEILRPLMADNHIADFRQYRIERVLMSGLMLLPMAFWGILMAVFEGLYDHDMSRMTGAGFGTEATASMSLVMQDSMRLPQLLDQWIASSVVLTGCVVYWLGEWMLLANPVGNRTLPDGV